MVREILSGLDEAEGCRALLVRAEGQYFTGGVDVNVFKGLSQEQAARLTTDLLAVTHRLEGLPMPTLASVHGLCLTAGLELVLACDMIWAAEVGPVRPRRGRDRPHAADGRHAAHRGAGRAGASP